MLWTHTSEIYKNIEHDHFRDLTKMVKILEVFLKFSQFSFRY